MALTGKWRMAAAMVTAVLAAAAWAVETASQPASQPAQTIEIDFQHARELLQKRRAGQTLTADEEAYLHEAMRQRQQGGGQRARQGEGGQAARESTGMIPLTDMTADDRYKDQDGGLYGGGNNEPPEAHRKAALGQLSRIRPLDGEGHPADDGKIVLISVGMSNTTREFARFKKMADADPEKSARVVIVDLAQGGQDAADWADEDGAKFAGVWRTVDERLKAAGVTADQVQVAWMKQARRQAAQLGEFPAHARELQGHLAGIARLLDQRFPNLRILYLASRTYAGYAASTLNPEPYAYEGAFSVRWLIQEQIDGSEGLKFDAGRGKVVAPLLLWGPYLWADGLKGRKIDDLVYTRDDFAADGTHPSESGQVKVSELLLRFLKTDPMAGSWFVGEAGKKP